VLKQGGEVAAEEGVHVHPYATILPNHQQADQIAICPRFLVAALQQRAIFERRAPGELVHVRNTELERIWIARDVAREQRIAGEVAIGPHDEARAWVLRSEEGLERVFLSLAERGEVGSPVGVVVGTRPVSVWRGGADGARKVVAVEAEAHGHARVHLCAPRAIQTLADVVERGRLLGLEASTQGRYGLDLLLHPRAPVEREFYVRLPDEVGEEEKEHEGKRGVFEA